MISISKTHKILFVCKGNICRSPFAKYYSKKILPNTMDISSSGYYSKTGRKCPTRAIKAAREYGINLKSHRSSVISKNMIEDVDIIFIFDDENKYMLFSSFPFAIEKIHLLGSLSENLPDIIPDPYGKNYISYKMTYQLISQAVHIINKSIK